MKTFTAVICLAVAATFLVASNGNAKMSVKQAKKECNAQHPKGSVRGSQLFSIRQQCIKQKMKK